MKLTASAILINQSAAEQQCARIRCTPRSKRTYLLRCQAVVRTIVATVASDKLRIFAPNILKRCDRLERVPNLALPESFVAGPAPNNRQHMTCGRQESNVRDEGNRAKHVWYYDKYTCDVSTPMRSSKNRCWQARSESVPIFPRMHGEARHNSKRAKTETIHDRSFFRPNLINATYAAKVHCLRQTFFPLSTCIQYSSAVNGFGQGGS